MSGCVPALMMGGESSCMAIQQVATASGGKLEVKHVPLDGKASSKDAEKEEDQGYPILTGPGGACTAGPDARSGQVSRHRRQQS